MVSADVEKRLWAAADQLWANTGLKPAQFSTPVLGLIFLRYAEKRFAELSGELDRLLRQELPALERKLDDAGVPWTPGRGAS